MASFFHPTTKCWLTFAFEKISTITTSCPKRQKKNLGLFFLPPKRRGWNIHPRFLSKQHVATKYCLSGSWLRFHGQVKPKACWSKAGDVATKRPPRKFDSPANPQPLFHRTCCNRCEKNKQYGVLFVHQVNFFFQNISAASNVKQKISMTKGIWNWKIPATLFPQQIPSPCQEKSHHTQVFQDVATSAVRNVEWTQNHLETIKLTIRIIQQKVVVLLLHFWHAPKTFRTKTRSKSFRKG